MSPGQYLRKRREVAGLDVTAVAAAIAALPWAIKQASRAEIDRLARRLEEAEADRNNLTVIQASLLRNAFAFDVDVYERLLWRHYGGENPNLPEPQVCRSCACSFHDACITDEGPCAWAEVDLCTACKRKDEATAELHAVATPQFHPEGVPA